MRQISGASALAPALTLMWLMSLTLLPAGPVLAAIDAETLQRLKRATVFVSLGQHRDAGSGSGFLVHRDGKRGLVVTNAHVAAKAAQGGLRVVFNSGTRKADSVRATLLGLSRSRDLAVLELQAPDLPEPLQISPDARVRETQTVHIVGFPFGKGFATNRETPVVTISRGTVSSQRMDVNDQARLMQIDGDVNPGNSGGPIVDETGQVIGVAVATVRQTNIGFAIPLAPLAEMMAGTLTDLHAELSARGVRISGRLLDPHGSFESARLNVRAMKEDAVLDLLSDDARWRSIAPSAPAAVFTNSGDGAYAALHDLPRNTPAGMSVVAQIIVRTGGSDRYLPPFRVQVSELSARLSGPDVRPPVTSGERAADEGAKGAATLATSGASESDLDELFARSGIAGLITSMGSAERGQFEQSTSNEDERTVKERLREIIAAQWDEARIKRTYVRSFEADPNADAQRRAMELFDLPAMDLLHLTADRLRSLSSREVAALQKRLKSTPLAFEKHLDLMREIDDKRNFSRALVAEVATSISSLARLLNEIKPTSRRMSPDLLQRDVERVVAGIKSRIRGVMPMVLANQYLEVDENDLRDYLRQLDSIAMRWFAQRELEAHTAVIKAQYAEAEDEIVQLFKEVRRESLGLAEAPDLDGKSDVQAMDALIQAYGKGPLIEFVLDRRGGEVTVSGRGGMRSRFGRPGQDKVSASTLARDLRAMKIDTKTFAVGLAQFLVDQAYKERRLTARAQSSRLIAALRERRRSTALSKSNARRERQERAARLHSARQYERTQKRQCEKTCRTQRSECYAVQKRSHSLCYRSAPRSGKARSRIISQCTQQRSAQRQACQTQSARCRDRC